MKDYLNLGKLRRSNIAYKRALQYYKMRNWEVAKTEYRDYIERVNSIDVDAYYECAICYFRIALKEKQKLQGQKSVDDKSKKKLDKLFAESIKYLQKALEFEPKNALFQNKLTEVKKQRR